MLTRLFYSASLFFMFFLPSSAISEHNSEHLPKPIDALLAKHRIPKEALSLYIKEYDARKPLLAVNVDVPRSPASVIKLVITQAALELLGPDYTWQTHVYLDGDLQGGILDGNLIIEGGGDPFLEHQAFWHLLFTLRNRGLQHINGDLLINNALFAKETGSPADFDNRPYRAYNAFPSALLLNLHVHHFHFIPAADAVHIYADPAMSNMLIRNRLRLVQGPCRNWRQQLKFELLRAGVMHIIEFSGDFPRHCGERILSRAVLQEKDYVFGVFTALWEGMGGTIGGNAGETTIAMDTPFYSQRSRPLHEIITAINKYSNNVMARQLLLTMAAEKYDVKGSKAVGSGVVLDWLRDIGIPVSDVFIENGSGLSRRTRISARSLAMLLQHIVKSQYQPELFASLPLVGVDGTAKKLLRDEIPPGYARIKTGMIDDVKTMAGYLRSKNDKNYIVVLLQNHSGIHHSVGALIQDQLLKWLYQQ